MNKLDIKMRLKEALDELFNVSEAGHMGFDGSKDSDDSGEGQKQKKKTGETGKKDYSDVKRSFEKLGGPSMVDVMKLTGIKDDEKGVNRSLFRKKVKQIGILELAYSNHVFE